MCFDNVDAVLASAVNGHLIASSGMAAIRREQKSSIWAAMQLEMGANARR